MVTITKAPSRRNARIKLVAASAALFLLIVIGIYLIQWFFLLSSGSGVGTQQLGIKGSPQSKQRILQSLTKLSQLIPLTPSSSAQNNSHNKEESFLSRALMECLPGRDDTGKDINPTTNRKRECLRHVPLGKKHINSGYDLEERMKHQRPRIGIMITPGYTSLTVANWIGHALKITGEKIHMDIEILITSHVPVYGYGKSHGYSKLIRLVTLPLPLAVNDSYYYSMNELTTDIVNESNNEFVIHNLDATLDEQKLKGTTKPSSQTIGSITELLLRWHCRLSHVAAHTAELTLTLDNLLKHPTDTLETILTFVWRQDWEWEGHNHNNQRTTMRREEEGGLFPKIWKGDAEEFVASEDGSLQPLLNQLSLLLQDDLLTSSSSFGETMRQSFVNEMIKSKDLTSWPCPSFWDGVETSVVSQIASEMTPNCRDGDPYARCTVNKDRCEMKKDAECK
jgi:hypothetical protein